MTLRLHPPMLPLARRALSLVALLAASTAFAQSPPPAAGPPLPAAGPGERAGGGPARRLRLARRLLARHA